MRSAIWAFVALLFISCGEDDDSVVEENRFPTLPAATPFSWADVEVGVGVRSGEAMGIATQRAEVLAEVSQTFPHAVLRLQTYDQGAQEVGEYLTFPAASTVISRGPVDFRASNVGAGKLSARAQDLSDEIDEFSQLADAEFTEKSVVVDFWRLRRDWYVRWDGELGEEANTVGRGPYGFFRSDFSRSILDDIESTASSLTPEYMVVGTDMQRLIRTPEGNGVAPSEFANFMGFYQLAIERIRRASPETKIGFGINWNHFVEFVAPQYGGDGVSEIEALDTAFELLLLPLLERSDILALSVYAQPGDDGSSYEFLRRLESLYGLAIPVVVYEVGTPVESVVDYLRQKNFIDDFEVWMAGLPVEFVAWKGMANFDGSDTSNQEPTGRCEVFQDSARSLDMPASGCYDGLVTSIFSKKEVFTYLQEKTAN